MDITAALTKAEVAALSDPELSWQNAPRAVSEAGEKDAHTALLGGLNFPWQDGQKNSGGKNAQGDGSRESNIFGASIKLKNTLDIVEEQAREKPAWKALSILLHCEALLFALNRGTPLRHNPFLSHWVEAIQRLSTNTLGPGKRVSGFEKKGGHVGYGPIEAYEINTARVGWIKALLRMTDGAPLPGPTPRVVYGVFVENMKKDDLELRPYIRMLEEEGIYERPSPIDYEEKDTTEPAASQSSLGDRRSWKQAILSQLENDPEAARRELTHLPIELQYLDFLSTLLQENILQRYSIDPAPVICDYLQHALRLVERMGQPPGTSAAGPSNGLTSGRYGDSDDIEYGRDAQAQAVKLLLLFIKNLIRKALLPPNAIYYEIQEICVRFVWIKEVRDFRAFIEQGGIVDQGGG